MDFGIIVIERPGSDPDTTVDPQGVDPLTDENYKIPIDLVGLIGEPAKTSDAWRASWGGGLNDSFTVYEFKGRVHGGGFLYLVDDRHAFVNGTIMFGDWEPGKYYIIVWAVDEWGNAR